MRVIVFLALTALVSADAFAVPVYWNTWASPSSGSLTTGSSTVAVTFATTNAHNNIPSYPTWSPSSTFEDGVLVDNGPAQANGIMQLTGGTTALNTLTFSTPVVNPVFAIWSLGQGGITASFDFVGVTPVFVAGGSNAEYGGSAIVVSGNTVNGNEGNGTIQFIGTFSSIQWTNPIFENWYGFNFGIADVGTPNSVPEPSPALLFVLGLGLLIGFRTLARARG
ncbi:MAG: hypothetical protein ACREPZ_02125 [Rhodanobacteraceae bacterium]